MFCYVLVSGQSPQPKVLNELLLQINTAIKNKQYETAFDSAMKYKNIALSIKDRNAVLRGFNIMGYCSRFQPKVRVTLSYFDSAHTYSNGREDKAILCKIYANRGLTLDSLKMYNEAITNFEIAGKHAMAIKEYQFAIEICSAELSSFATKNGFLAKKRINKELMNEINYYSKRLLDLESKYGVKQRPLEYTY